MTTVFLKVISGILQQHEELLRKCKQKALKLKEYDGIFLNARTTGGRTYFTGHRPGKKPKYIGNEKHTTVQRIQNLRATKVLISMLESNIAALKHFQDNYIDITTEEIRKRLPKCYVPANLREAELSLDTAQKWYQKLLELKESIPVKYPEKCTVSTIDGTLVRSRIEAIIYDIFWNISVTCITMQRVPGTATISASKPSSSPLSALFWAKIFSQPSKTAAVPSIQKK